ncbi:MAG TPA: M23 family metallopeptidase [Spirochaetota bacterium]|nr:M23 family metallopeptidase [Spirochaetota bacterium]
MSDRAASIPGLVLAAAIIALALYGTLSARKDDGVAVKGKEIDRLEDAIILEGLEMNTEIPPESETADHGGMILYDEDFIVEGDSPEHIAKKDDAGNADSILAGLKKEDARWHARDYTIRRGDNLWTIAKKFGIDHRLIIRINEIRNPDSLRPGKKIMVPCRTGVYYTVRRGDTITGIASRYRIGAGKISSHNEITSLIKPGMRIFLPGGVAPVVRRRTVSQDRGAIADNRMLKKDILKMSFSWPVRGRITSSFGDRRDPFTKKRRFHCGIDISLEPGTPVKAAADGTVIFSGWKDGYGSVVVIKHEKGYITVYAHNKSNGVKEGEEVKRGQEIALSGMSGLATGGHLHFEIRKYLTPLNPLRLLR